ncbi:hypothetical protein NFI96_008409 [Prochilodus magdalenae]|nr:hypothetical protein NFI96_008409 [Prochilodus magdalenae]
MTTSTYCTRSSKTWWMGTLFPVALVPERDFCAIYGGTECKNNPSVEVRRECVLKALCVYLNEKPDSLMKECLDVDLVSMREMEKMVLGVYVVRHEGADSTDPPEDVGIVIEGCTVLQDLGDVASGCAVLLGLIYSLNLSYPKDLRYTFEFLQKVLMELDGNKLSNKVQVLKNKLHE